MTIEQHPLPWTELEPECQVWLVCPARVEKSVYLYYELGEFYAVEDEVSISMLVE